MADLALAELAEFLLGDLFPLLGAHHRQKFFTKECVGHPKHLHIGNPGMANQELLDLSREEVFAATNDHLLEATHDVDITMSIHRCQVAGVQPARTINGLGGLLRHVVVALHDQVAPTAQLATLPTRHHFTGDRVDHLDLSVGQRYAHCGGFQVKRITWQRLRNDWAGFGLPKDDGHIRPDALFDLLHQVDWHWGAAAEHLLE